jgi:hypothetical protein
MNEDNVQKLSEGYDFIEESCGYMPLEFEACPETKIMESQSGGSFRILGKACGPFQPIGEFSRNNRLYEVDHWDRVLENAQFQDRLAHRDLAGTIGHHDKKVDDNDFASGVVSHIVTCLEKREDENGKPYLYGELEILDTPAGRILEALYEGGANLYVSSRGAGKLLPVPGQTYKKVDKDHYFCETFDIVRRPGFLKAKPIYEHVPVKESITESDNNMKEENVSEIAQLKNQVEKLASVMEKVIEDIYEEDNSEKLTEQQQAALIGPLSLISESKVSKKDKATILEAIKKGLNK